MKGPCLAQHKGIVGRSGKGLVKCLVGFGDAVDAGQHNAAPHARKTILARKTLLSRLLVAIAGPQKGFNAGKALVVLRAALHRLAHALNAGLKPVDTVADGRVGRKIGGHVGAAHPTFLTQHLKAVHHALRRVARSHKVLQANLVCLGFINAAVVEHGRLASAHRTHGNGPAAGTAQGDARNGQQQ